VIERDINNKLFFLFLNIKKGVKKMEKCEINQENNCGLDGLEIFGGIYSKLNDFYIGKCNKNDLKDELELMIIIANR